MDAGLRRRRRRRPAATTSSFHHGHRGAGERLGGAGEPIDIFGHGDEHRGHQRHLERERHCRRKFGAWHDHVHGRIHRSRRPACHGKRTNHGNKPRRCHEIRLSQRDYHQRYRIGADTESSERGAGGDTSISSERHEQRASRRHSALESFRYRMSERVRNRGQQRPLHSAGNSSASGERDANGTKRGGPFETSFPGADDHQQLFIATVRAIERARGGHGDDRGDDDSGSKLQTEHGAGLVVKGPGCSGTSCGTLTVVTTQSVGGGSISNFATYTAPNPNTVTVTVTPQADPTKTAQATIAIQPGIA